MCLVRATHLTWNNLERLFCLLCIHRIILMAFFFVFIRASSPKCTNRRWMCFIYFVGFLPRVCRMFKSLIFVFSNHGASASLFCLLTITYALFCKELFISHIDKNELVGAFVFVFNNCVLYVQRIFISLLGEHNQWAPPFVFSMSLSLFLSLSPCVFFFLLYYAYLRRSDRCFV